MPIVHDASAFPDEILALWAKLALRTGQADPLSCAPDWNLAFHRIMTPDTPLFYLCDGESLLLLSEVRLENGAAALAPVESSWLFCQPLLGQGAVDLLVCALAMHSRLGEPPAAVFLSGAQPGNLHSMLLYRRFARAYHFALYNAAIHCAASLDGGLDGWLSRRSANCRAKLKKAARKASGRGLVFERHRPDNPGEARTLYARMLAIEEKSWKGIGKCGMAEPPSREFYGELLRRLSLSRSGLVIIAKAGEEDLGFIFGCYNGGVYRGQQFSYAETARDLSLGNVMQLEKVRWLCELGAWRYDMGPITGPRMSYKAHWTELRLPAQTWMLKA